jgi:TolB-like protein
VDEDRGSPIVRLGGAVLDMNGGTLTRDGSLLPLRAKSFRLLCELARHRGRVLSKEALLDAVWPDVVVTEDSLTQAVRDIRRTLGDDGALLRTVAGRGFILAAEEPAAAPQAATPLTRPRIAILPLRDLTGAPDLAPVLDGLVEEMTAGLARFRNLVVVARHSAFAAARDGLDLATLAERLRADFVVDGSARRLGARLRLSFALNDARTGEVLWSDAFDAEAEGWLTLQDLLPRRIVQRLFTGIEDAGHQGALRRASGNLSAFEHLARGRALFRSFEPGVNEAARDHFAAAIAADPTLGIAHSLLASR